MISIMIRYIDDNEKRSMNSMHIWGMWSWANYGNDDDLMNYNNHLVNNEHNDDKGAKFQKSKQ